MSSDIKNQLWRGLAGIILVILAIMLFNRHLYIPAFLTCAVSFFFFRGCPTCWLFTTCGKLYCDSKTKSKEQKNDVPTNDGKSTAQSKIAIPLNTEVKK